VTERLADNNCVVAAQFWQDFRSRAAGQEIGGVLDLRIRQIDTAEGCGQSLVADFVSTKALNRADTGQFREPIGEFRRDHRMLVGRGTSGWPEIEVCR